MPDDVIKQFLFDHGLKSHIQRQYGDLDIHCIKWSCQELSAASIMEASIYQDFECHVNLTSERTFKVSDQGWKSIALRTDGKEHWRLHGTWLRPPVFFQNISNLNSGKLHLVEGHTRLGALKGLVRCGVISTESIHQIWIGEPSEEESSLDSTGLIRKYPISFLDWLFDINDAQEFGDLSSAVLYCYTPDGNYESLLNRIDEGLELKEWKRSLDEARARWASHYHAL